MFRIIGIVLLLSACGASKDEDSNECVPLYPDGLCYHLETKDVCMANGEAMAASIEGTCQQE